MPRGAVAWSETRARMRAGNGPWCGLMEGEIVEFRLRIDHPFVACAARRAPALLRRSGRIVRARKAAQAPPAVNGRANVM